MHRDFVKNRMFRSLPVLKAGAGTWICLLETLMVPRFLRSPRFAFATLGTLSVFTAISHKSFIFSLPGGGSIRRYGRIKCLQNWYLWVVLYDLILQNALISIADQTSCHLIWRCTTAEILLTLDNSTREVLGFNLLKNSYPVHKLPIFLLNNLYPPFCLLLASSELPDLFK